MSGLLEYARLEAKRSRKVWCRGCGDKVPQNEVDQGVCRSCAERRARRAEWATEVHRQRIRLEGLPLPAGVRVVGTAGV